MSNWKQYTINLGNVVANTTRTVKFESKHPLDISSIQPGCASCTKVLGYEDNVLTIRFDAPSFPVHLLGKESVIDKFIDVYYKDGTQERLKFVGFLKHK